MKRFVCFLLALILIVGLVPATAVTASAASERTTSDKAINILKGSVAFYTKEDGNHKIGYSTPSSYSEAKKYLNFISKEDADTLLRSYLKKEVDKAINDFAKSHNLDLLQQEHDALAVHLYRTGSLKTDGHLFATAGIVKTVSTAADRQAIVDAFVQARSHDYYNNETVGITVNVSLAEASMYLFGDYVYNGDPRMAFARIDKNGDFKADGVVGYVKAEGYTLQPLADNDFLGWYLYSYDTENKKDTLVGAPLTKLDQNHYGALIVAKKNTNIVSASYNINTSTLVDLNLYYHYDDVIERRDITLKNNTNFAVNSEFIDTDGVKWVYGTGKSTAGKNVEGWIKLGKHEAINPDINKPIATATINATTRVYPGATADGAEPVSTLYKNDVVNVYETKIEKTETGNKLWAKITYKNAAGNPVFGWINLVNATVNSTTGESGAEEGKTGKIANTDYVNVRSSAEIKENWITSLKAGTKVTILEMNADRSWAKIKWSEPSHGYTQGWVYMHYVQLDGSAQGSVNGESHPETILYTGVVTSNINLNVREYADVYARRVDSLPTGTKVNVYELADFRNMSWGRIGEDRWVCISYLSLTKVENNTNNNTSGDSVTSLQGTVTKATLDVLKNYNSNAQVLGTLKKGDVVTILEKNTENTTTGSRIWGRIEKDGVKGWINLAYVDMKTVTTVAPGTGSGSSATPAAPIPAIISDCISVNVREEAGVYSRQITKLNNGTSVTVLEQITHASAPWARIKWNNGANEGWVCMYYVTLNAGTGSANTNSNGILNGTSSNAISATGFVNNAYLNVRGGAGLNFAQLGTLNQGAKVTIFEQAVSDGLIWGRISYNNTSGWVCMSYITVENASSTGKGVMGTIARCYAKANVRSAPGTNNALVSTVNVGSRVEVFEVKTHAAQKWGRIPQGWICMDYVLLDSELPEGTILDATTAPTTEATTAPTGDIKKEGEVAFKIEAEVYGTTDKPVSVYNDTTTKSDRVGTISTTLNVDIRALKNNGGELWGRIDQYGTAGWIAISNSASNNWDCRVKYWFEGFVNEKDAPVYVDANLSSAVKGRLAINTEFSDDPSSDALTHQITKVTTDGTNVYGWVERNIYGWIPMSKISSNPVDVIPVLKSGDNVGSGKFNPIILHGTTFAKMNAYDVIGGSKVLFEMESGVNVHVTHIRFENGKIWGRVEQPKKPGFYANWLDYALDGGEYSENGEAWFDLSKVNYSLAADTEVDKVRVRSSMDNSMTEDDNPNNIVGNVTGTINICQLAFDSYGNLWARITGHSDTQLNGMFVMVRTAAQGVDGYEVKNYGKMFIGNQDVVISPPNPDITVLPEGDIDSALTPDMT